MFASRSLLRISSVTTELAPFVRSGDVRAVRRYCIIRPSRAREPLIVPATPRQPLTRSRCSAASRSSVSAFFPVLTMLQSAFSSHSSTHQPLDAVDNETLPNALHHVDVPTKKATFAMACFWAPDALFGATPGVIKTRVGYCGGAKNNPTYRDLGDHTEAIDVDYDPNQITYEKLLELFWANHDPTARLKTQYTSFIFYHDEDQKAAAEKTMKEQEKTHKRPLVTVVSSS
uniref:peptide-methionine (S)-S-oxide reductase n=1 Tax=Lygus hesperus TaxID=30085 RepID=A0A0K8SDE3_LYGHE